MIKLKSLIESKERRLTISKVEEAEALDFIKKCIISIALKSYNQYSNNHGFEPVEASEIQKNLRKTDVDFPLSNVKNPIVTSSAYNPQIFYDSEVDGLKWTFTIYKNLIDDEIYIRWKHPYNFSGQAYPLKHKCNYLYNYLTEVGHGGYTYFKEDAVDISKLDEDFALNYINKVVIPKMIDAEYNQFLGKYPKWSIERFPRIGYNTVRQNLKKILREPKRIYYNSKITNDVKFEFDVVKYTRESHDYATEMTRIFVKAHMNFGNILRDRIFSVPHSEVDNI